MVDGVTLPGTGKDVATDEIDGVHYQRVKPAVGKDGTAVDVSVEDPFPILDLTVEDLLHAILLELRLLSHHAGLVTRSEATSDEMEH